jgi:hypothetical protein
MQKDLDSDVFKKITIKKHTFLFRRYIKFQINHF